MADKKITELTNITGANLVDADEFVVVDISADETKAITLGELKEAFDSGSGFVRITGDTMTGDLGLSGADVTFGDNDKAIFGAGSDLQIYHNGSASYIEDAGQGNLLIKTDGTKIALQDGSGTNMLQARTNGGVELAYLGVNKLATTSTGVDITGTITSDGLTVAQGSGANILLESTTTGATTGDIFGEIEFKTNDSNSAGIKGKIDSYSEGAVGNGALRLFTGDTTGLYQRLNIASNGDISFYEDTGTTPKFFWDASAESLGIGTTSPASIIHSLHPTSPKLTLERDSTSLANNNVIGEIAMAHKDSNDAGTAVRIIGRAEGTGGAAGLAFNTGLPSSTAERMRISSSGNVGIGTSSPNYPMTIHNTGDGIKFEVSDTVDANYRVQVSGNDIITGPSTASDYIFQTGNAERMRIDSSGNVGIGTSSPSSKLHVSGTYDTIFDGNSVQFTRAGPSYIQNNTAGGYTVFQQASGEAMRLDASGNLLVGMTSVSGSTVGAGVLASGLIYNTRDSGHALQVNRNTSDGDIVQFRKDGTTVGSIFSSGGIQMGIGDGDTGLLFGDNIDAIMPWSTSNTQRDNATDLGRSTTRFKDLYLSGGVIQSDGGQSIFGGGGTVDALVAVSVQGAANADAMEIKVRTNGKNAIEFRNSSNATVGKITANSSSTTYATTSDYRLKTDVQAVTNATNRLKQLNPVNFEWIADGTRVDGFLAHEAQAIVPEAVTGTQDAMRDEEYEVTPAVLDDDGNVVTEAVMGTRSVPDYQGIDQSKLVPLLTAALQEALTKIDALETRITALEG
jgi:hypothetical protein